VRIKEIHNSVKRHNNIKIIFVLGIMRIDEITHLNEFYNLYFQSDLVNVDAL
jgi:cell division protein ZapA (FtsZ GTPase activity inhibitor)